MVPGRLITIAVAVAHVRSNGILPAFCSHRRHFNSVLGPLKQEYNLVTSQSNHGSVLSLGSSSFAIASY